MHYLLTLLMAAPLLVTTLRCYIGMHGSALGIMEKNDTENETYMCEYVPKNPCEFDEPAEYGIEKFDKFFTNFCWTRNRAVCFCASDLCNGNYGLLLRTWRNTGNKDDEKYGCVESHFKKLLDKGTTYGPVFDIAKDAETVTTMLDTTLKALQLRHFKETISTTTTVENSKKFTNSQTLAWNDSIVKDGTTFSTSVKGTSENASKTSHLTTTVSEILSNIASTTENESNASENPETASHSSKTDEIGTAVMSYERSTIFDRMEVPETVTAVKQDESMTTYDKPTTSETTISDETTALGSALKAGTSKVVSDKYIDGNSSLVKGLKVQRSVRYSRNSLDNMKISEKKIINNFQENTDVYDWTLFTILAIIAAVLILLVIPLLLYFIVRVQV